MSAKSFTWSIDAVVILSFFVRTLARLRVERASYIVGEKVI